MSMAVMAQKKSVVRLIKSQRTEGVKINGKDVIKVQKGTFQQDYSIMISDSAYLYVQDNAFDAFGHVHITQGDTLNIYADKLNYNGNTKIALLTDNVRMIDKDAVLTTNFLTYNTATRIGTYNGGGKLVNKDNTLTSKNGYYFAFSRDAYFRYNVVLVTPEALIKTDTLRYSTASRIAYFLGPTNIYDVKDKKDTLYTENGTYNTVTEQALFGKKNVYKQGTKTLRGDSLFYDKVKGYGRATRHVVFNDREQNITLKGDLANYYKADERTVVTKDPYVIIVTEEKDTTKTDTVPLTSKAKGKDVKAAKTDAKKPAVVNTAPANTMPIKAMPGLPVNLPNADTIAKKVKAAIPPNTNIKAIPGLPVKTAQTDSLLKKVTAAAKPKLTGGAPAVDGADTTKKIAAGKGKIKRDSIYISADTLETQMMTYKNYKLMLEKIRLSRIRDTTAKAGKGKVASAKESKFLTLKHPGFGNDSSYLHRDFFGKPKPQAPKDTIKAAAANAKTDGKKTVKSAGDSKADTIKKAPARPDVETDPVFTASTKINLSDTARIRIVKAYHHAKLFKSDLQAKSDSMFYSGTDSTLRMYTQPIIWTQGSQLSGDTINLQMKNKKLDNMDMFPSSFIVNVEKNDSLHYNQIAAKRMKGFFKNDKLDRMFITGNAESIYFTRDSGKVSGMQRSLSSRMRILFKNNNASNIFFLTKPEHRYGPLKKFEEDERILKGFIWKPKERPFSKESILPSYARKHNPPAVKGTAKNPGDKSPSGLNKRAPGDSVLNKLPGGTLKTGKDSLLNKLPGSTPVKGGKDSTGSKLPLLKTGKDTVPAKPLPLAKPKADTATVKKPKKP
jgi:lipopolysaccharide export system protein LptA